MLTRPPGAYPGKQDSAPGRPARGEPKRGEGKGKQMILQKKRLCDVLMVRARRWVWVAYHDEQIEGRTELIGVYRTRREAEEDLLGTNTRRGPGN